MLWSDIKWHMICIRTNLQSVKIKLNHFYVYRFWPTIDNALRQVAFDKGIKVQLLTSKWPSTSGDQTAFIQSLNEFGKMPSINGSITVVSVETIFLQCFFFIYKNSKNYRSSQVKLV